MLELLSSVEVRDDPNIPTASDLHNTPETFRQIKGIIDVV